MDSASAAPTPHPVRSVALVLLAGFGNPVGARVRSHYEWTSRLLNRHMRQAVLGFDGVSALFRWTSIQLNAFFAYHKKYFPQEYYHSESWRVSPHYDNVFVDSE